MDNRQAEEVAALISGYLVAGDIAAAYRPLRPILTKKTPFRMLDRIGRAAGVSPWPATGAFLDQVAADGREGGWVIIGAFLRQQYPIQAESVISHCRRHIIAADTWYGADILGERVPGPALAKEFSSALELLAPWRADANRWLRRSVGVAVHFWAKRSRGDEALAGQARALLDFLAPMFEERNMDAVKGIGWGLKTLGRHYPEPVARWLIAQRDRPHRRLLLRKAVTYLPEQERQRVLTAHGL